MGAVRHVSSWGVKATAGRPPRQNQLFLKETRPVIKPLDSATLKTGEQMDIVRVTTPEDGYAERLDAFLGHKGDPWIYHVGKAFEGDTDDLENYFYVGLLGDEVVFNVMTAEYKGVGNFGHVYTSPEHRRKHAASLVIERQMADFRERGGKALYLGTGYDSTAYHIYSRCGFESLTPKSGLMTYLADDRVIEEHFSPGPVRVEDAAWRHWPMVFMLTLQPGGRWLRNVALGCLGPHGIEGGYLAMRQRQLQRNEPVQAKVLVTEQDSAVGFATLMPDTRWGSNVGLLDVFVHPGFSGSTRLVLDSFDYTRRKTQSFVETDAEETITEFQASGFEIEGTLKGQIEVNGESSDVVALARGPG